MQRRHTPARRRMACPECGRDTAYSHPWTTPYGGGDLVRDRGVALFSAHKSPSTGQPCPVNGPSGFGHTLP